MRPVGTTTTKTDSLSPMPGPKSDKPQFDKFRDLARDLEADEDEAAFEEQVRKVAKKGEFKEGRRRGE